MIKVLFLIHDLGQGGAEKVLVNLVNNIDKTKFSVTVVSLFSGGVNEQFLNEDVGYRSIFKKAIPGNSHFMKLLSPGQLHDICVKEKYDIEVSYLEGPSARIISGCKDNNTKLVSWIHSDQSSISILAASFRNFGEAKKCYLNFDKHIFVAEQLRDSFCKLIDVSNESRILFNTNETEQIKEKANEAIEIDINSNFTMIAVGSLKEIKGYDRLLNIAKRLKNEGRNFKLIILGIGPLEEKMRAFISNENLAEHVYMLGYNTNPYKYVARADVFVCSSYSEGFSTSTTEALIVGTPVCTVRVSGMKEMLGDSEYGLITENSEDDLYRGIVKLMDNSDLLQHYKSMSQIRGKVFSLDNTVHEVEDFFESLVLGDKK